MNNKKRPQYKNLQNPKNNDKNEIKTYNVETPCELLEFLYQNLTGMSANKVKSTLKYKLVAVDGKISTKFNYMLKAGQVVTVSKYTPVYATVQDVPEIIFEDSDILVINKPAGLLSIGTEDEKENTAYHQLLEYEKSKNPHNRIYVVHRLDRDTSGILIFAKNEDIKMAFQENWDDLCKLRGYTALIEGCPDKKEGRVESWLRETDTRLVYSARSEGDGKFAITNYKVVKASELYSMVEVNIETGRKNQIRVHMKDIGCPIAGDKKYGAKTNPIKRLCLHADKLIVEHPFTGKELNFAVPVPKKFLTALKSASENSSSACDNRNGYGNKKNFKDKNDKYRR